MLEPTRNGTVVHTSTLAPAKEPEVPERNVGTMAGRVEVADDFDATPASLVPPPPKTTRNKRGPQKNPRGGKKKGAELAPVVVEKAPLTDEDFAALGRATHKAMQLGQSLPFYIESLKAEIAAFEKMV